MKNWKLFLLSLSCLSLSLLIVPQAGAQDAQVTKEIQLDAFHSISLAGSSTVNIYKGATQKVVFKGSQKALEDLSTKVEDGDWEIHFNKNGKQNRNWKDHKGVVIDITMPEVKGLSLAGSGSIKGHNAFEGMKELDLSLAGSGDIEFTGSAAEVNVSIAGSGDVKCGGLKAEKCEVSIAGSGDCEVAVGKKLNVSIVGSGDVRYKGSPEVDSSIMGSGKVRTM